WFLARGLALMGVVGLGGAVLGVIAGGLTLVPLEGAWQRNTAMASGMALMIALMLLIERFRPRADDLQERRGLDG
ncbi:MAG: hypothetical protein D6753_16150, partial [Planctomycetota bacterium]